MAGAIGVSWFSDPFSLILGSREKKTEMRATVQPRKNICGLSQSSKRDETFEK